MSKRLKKQIRLFEPSLVNQSIKDSFIKLNPRLMMKNPVMFCVEIGTANHAVRFHLFIDQHNARFCVL